MAVIGIVFQSTPLREGRQREYAQLLVMAEFQSTPLREGRRYASFSADPAPEFQSTPLREGRRGASWRSRIFSCFNPRPCVRGDENRLTLAYIA